MKQDGAEEMPGPIADSAAVSITWTVTSTASPFRKQLPAGGFGLAGWSR